MENKETIYPQELNGWEKVLQIRKGSSPTLKKATNKEVIKMIQRFHVLMGISNVLSDNLLSILIEEIKRNLWYWKIEEVENAFNLGLNNKLNIDMKLYNKPFNLVFLSSLMNAYREYIRPILDTERQDKQEEKIEPTDAEKKRIALEAIKSCFDQYKLNGLLRNFGNSIYKALQDKINYQDDEFYERAKSIYKEELEIQKSKVHYRGAINELISKIEMEEVDSDIESKIRRIICDLKLKRYFDELIEMDASPEDYLD